MRVRLLTLILFLFPTYAISQSITPSEIRVVLSVCDADSKEPLIGAPIKMERGESKYTGATNAKGQITFTPKAIGTYQVQAAYIGYDKKVETIKVNPGAQEFVIYLKSSTNELQEVVVTATSSRGMTSSSKIGKEAMTHLQPSSIGDLLELLPGGFSSDPQLTTPDIIRLREATLPIIGQHNMLPRVNQSNYNTSSMGTVFMIDGVPIKADANLEGMYGNNYDYKERININSGVDMRSIATDDVESVEVVRGIPSVEHSDLTSGLIKVKRKQWTDEMNARFKSDMSSKLFYLSKGVTLPKSPMNIIGSIGYLSAYSDPRSVRECYERLTGSVRIVGNYALPQGKLNTMSSVDYTGTIDDRKRDQDLDFTPNDSYKADYHRLSLSQTIGYTPTPNKWLSALDLTLSISHTWDKTIISKDIVMNRDTPYLTSKEEGEFEGKYYPRNYIAHHTVDSRPLYLYAKIKGSSHFDSDWAEQKMIYGSTYTYSKNLGKGAIFDLDKPLFWLSTTRPRSFDDVPGKSVVSLFIEDNITIPIAQHRITLMAGAVSNQLLGLSPEYTMYGKWYTDIRTNLRWSVAPILIKGQPLSIQLLAGIGSLSMFPSMEQLFPDTIYDDFVELNYYHINPAYRLVYMRTYIYHPNNADLKPAHNLKMELRSDIDYAGYSGSVTWFYETMKDGFRKDTELKIASFKSYDPKSVPVGSVTAKPQIEDFTYTDSKDFRFLIRDTNGSETTKMGVEWVLSTPRYRLFNTRITLTGAWFRTIYRNSLPQYERPRAVIGGKEVGYVGVYQDNEILVRELLNTDLRFDSYLPKIALGVSFSLQSNWFSSSQKKPISIYPDHYVSLEDGKTYSYDEQHKKDAYLQWLKRDYNDSFFEKYMVPFMMITNLKATKRLFENRLQVALFVNKIFDYAPDIKRNGYVIRRNQYPYFGMELMLTL